MHTVRCRECPKTLRPLHVLALTVLAFATGCTREAPSSSSAQPSKMTLSAAVPAGTAAAGPSAGAVALGAGAVSVRRPIPGGAGGIFLVLQGMGADAPPGVVFRVYVDDASTSAHIDDAHYAGTINFFNYQRTPQTSYDVTTLVEPILKRGQSEVVITFVPVDGPPAPGSHARIDEVKLARQ